MVERFIRLLGTALLLDGFLVVVTVPLTRFFISIVLPETISPEYVLQTYGMVVFIGLLAVTLYFAWYLEAWYVEFFSFWQLLFMMMLIFFIVVYWKSFFPSFLPTQIVFVSDIFFGYFSK